MRSSMAAVSDRVWRSSSHSLDDIRVKWIELGWPRLTLLVARHVLRRQVTGHGVARHAQTRCDLTIPTSVISCMMASPRRKTPYKRNPHSRGGGSHLIIAESPATDDDCDVLADLLQEVGNIWRLNDRHFWALQALGIGEEGAASSCFRGRIGRPVG